MNLTQEDWVKVGKGLLIAVGGAALTYIAEFASNTDFGSLTPIVTAAASVLVNVGRKWLSRLG